MSERPQPLRIRVYPEPAPEEMAAISAAVAALASLPGADGEDQSPATVDGRERWKEAARREILRANERDS